MVKKKNSPNSVSTISSAETSRLGTKLGRLLKAGDVAALSGPLGAGKTTFVKGVVRGLGSKDFVCSPTFTLIHEYQGREKIYHLDWYRLKKVVSADRQMAEECFQDHAVTLVEWPERGKNILPKNSIRIRIVHGGKNKRTISWKGITL